jgi:hypothetical protein
VDEAVALVYLIGSVEAEVNADIVEDNSGDHEPNREVVLLR